MIEWTAILSLLKASAIKLAKPVYTGSRYLYGYIFKRKPSVFVEPARVTALELFYKSECYALMTRNLRATYSYRNDRSPEVIVYETLAEFPTCLKNLKNVHYVSLLEDWDRLGPLLPAFYDFKPTRLNQSYFPKFDKDDYFGVLSVTVDVTVILQNDWLYQTRANINTEKDESKQNQELTLPNVSFPAGWKIMCRMQAEGTGLLKIKSRESEDVPCVIKIFLVPPDASDADIDHVKEAFNRLRASQELYLYLRDDGVIDIPITINLPNRKTCYRNLQIHLKDEMAAKTEAGKHFVMVAQVDLVEQSWKRIATAFFKYAVASLEAEVRKDRESWSDSS